MTPVAQPPLCLFGLSSRQQLAGAGGEVSSVGGVVGWPSRGFAGAEAVAHCKHLQEFTALSSTARCFPRVIVIFAQIIALMGSCCFRPCVTERIPQFQLYGWS